MSLSEATRLSRGLLVDSTSHTFTAVAGWAYPMSREAIIAADQFDAYRRVNFKHPKPLPRPWKTDGPTVEHKGTTDLTQEEVIAALRAAGHHMPLPTNAA